jgi:hypothetical protein
MIEPPRAGVDGEVVDALLGLLDQRVLEHLPVELVGVAVDFFECLVDRHGADRHRRVAQDPAADVVDVAPGRQVHHRVGAPTDRPDQFFDFFGGAGGDGGVADVGVDLHQEVAADDDRFELGVVDVGGDDGAAAGDLAADELGGDEGGDLGAKTFAVGDALGGTVQHRLAAHVLAVRDVEHLLGDDAGAGELVLGDEFSGFAAVDRVVRGAFGDQAVAGDAAVVLRLHRAGGDAVEAALGQPLGADRGQAGFQVDGDRRVGVDAGAVIGAVGLFPRRGVQGDLAERHVDVRPALGRGVDLARAGDRAGGHAGWAGGGFRLDRHWRLLGRGGADGGIGGAGW